MGVGAAIAAVAMAVPERLVSDEQLAARLGVDADWITKRTGTRERPWVTADERLSEFAAERSAERDGDEVATRLVHARRHALLDHAQRVTPARHRAVAHLPE
jgi:3-oxoacyl-[acyl-carrier-protein] synthase III